MDGAARGGVPRSCEGPIPLDPNHDVLFPGSWRSHRSGPAGSIYLEETSHMKTSLACRALVGLLASAASSAPTVAPGPDGARAQQPALVVERGWVAALDNNLCGLRDLNQLSNPAKLNYKRCLDATPEMKRVRKEGIKLTSPEGIQLKNAAATRVSTAASTIRKAGGFCSVWKAIKHNDGRKVSDITARVISQY